MAFAALLDQKEGCWAAYHPQWCPGGNQDAMAVCHGAGKDFFFRNPFNCADVFIHVF